MGVAGKIDKLQSAGVLLGISGAGLQSLVLVEAKCFGFVLWIVGNGAWIWWSIKNKNPYMLSMMTIYWMLAVYGLYNHLH